MGAKQQPNDGPSALERPSNGVQTPSFRCPNGDCQREVEGWQLEKAESPAGVEYAVCSECVSRVESGEAALVRQCEGFNPAQR